MSTSLTLLLLLFLALSTVTSTHSSSLLSFIYGGCSRVNYTSDDVDYKINLNSLLTSLVTSAAYSSYNHLTTHVTNSTTVLHGLYQCRGDLSIPDCATCVATSVTRLSSFCPNTCGAVMQLNGCFLKYDNDSFIGAQDKSVIVKKCGPGGDRGDISTRDAVLDGLLGGPYRVGGTREVEAMAQCVGDLSEEECDDCVSVGVREAKEECGEAEFGEVYLGKCYVRYTLGGAHSYFSATNNDDFTNGTEKNRSVRTFAWIIGGLAAIAILIIFFTFICRAFGTTPPDDMIRVKG